MTSRLCNPEYYIGTFLEIRKSMKVRKEGMELQEEAALLMCSFTLKHRSFLPAPLILLPAPHYFLKSRITRFILFQITRVFSEIEF